MLHSTISRKSHRSNFLKKCSEGCQLITENYVEQKQLLTQELLGLNHESSVNFIYRKDKNKVREAQNNPT